MYPCGHLLKTASNSANGVSTPCGDTIATTTKRTETGIEQLDYDPRTVFGQRVLDQGIEPTGIYMYGSSVNTCTPCQQQFIDHKSWKDHLKQRHAHIIPRYQCSKCSRTYPSIFGISSHFPKCIQPSTDSSVPTVKLPSAQKEVLVSTNKGNIPLSTKPIKILSGSKNDGPKKSSNSWLNVKLPSLNTSPTTINSCIPTSLIAPSRASKEFQREKSTSNYYKL